MSESVQRRLEVISEEIEELKRTNICKREEYNYIAKNYFNYENKINSQNKSTATFKEYINYVVTVIKLIKLRRVAKEIGERKHKLEYKMLHRVRGLYEMAIKYFPSDVELYLDFFKFCKEMHFIDAAASTAICNLMIKHHQQNPLVWLTAARWNYHQKKDTNYAKKLLQQAMKIHKDNSEIYKECLLYEMRGVHQVKSEFANETEALKLAVYASNMFENIKSTDFFLDLLTWLDNYPNTKQLQKQIIEHLIKEHKSNEYTWDYLAQRERRGVHYSEQLGIVSARPSEVLNNCIDMYERGINETSDQNRMNLWNLYISCLVDAKNEKSGMTKEMESTILIPAFEKASIMACMPEKCYIAWLELVDDEKARNVLKLANEKIPLSVDLWKLRLQLEISRGNADDIIGAFDEGIETLREKSAPLWFTYIGYLILTSDDERVKMCYKRGFEFGPEVAKELKPRYIEWMAIDKPIEKARGEYLRLSKEKPFCKEMYNVMCRVEKAHCFRDLNFLEKIHKYAIEQVGRTDSDPWVNLLNFHLHYNFQSGINLGQVTKELFTSAREKLEEMEFLEFEHKYDSILKEFQERKAMITE